MTEETEETLKRLRENRSKGQKMHTFHAISELSHRGLVKNHGFLAAKVVLILLLALFRKTYI